MARPLFLFATVCKISSEESQCLAKSVVPVEGGVNAIFRAPLHIQTYLLHLLESLDGIIKNDVITTTVYGKGYGLELHNLSFWQGNETFEN